jgi:hypothetical protein
MKRFSFLAAASVVAMTVISSCPAHAGCVNGTYYQGFTNHPKYNYNPCLPIQSRVGAQGDSRGGLNTPYARTTSIGPKRGDRSTNFGGGPDGGGRVATGDLYTYEHNKPPVAVDNRRMNQPGQPYVAVQQQNQLMQGYQTQQQNFRKP